MQTFILRGKAPSESISGQRESGRYDTYLFSGTNFAQHIQLDDATEMVIPNRCREAAVEDFKVAGGSGKSYRVERNGWCYARFIV